MASFQLELRRKNTSGLLVAALLLFNGLGLALVLTAGRYPISLYVRNALFSEVADDQQVPSEASTFLAEGAEAPHPPRSSLAVGSVSVHQH